MNLRSRWLGPLLSLSLLAGCRDSDVDIAGAQMQPILPSEFGASGCIGPDQTFTVGQLPVVVPLVTLSPGPLSQVAAARGSEVLYATGAGATVVEIDFTGGGAPVETELVSAGTIATLYGQPEFMIAGAPVLSGVTVLDADTLLVMEHTANVLLLIDRTTPNLVQLAAGLPSEVPGFADGFALQVGMDPLPLARFDFDAPAQLVVEGGAAPRVFVADSGNHALRAVDPSGQVQTLAGGGTPFFGDGNLTQVFFDTPTGLSIACNDSLYLSEGDGSVSGNRVRRLTIGNESIFGIGFDGFSETIVGDGTATTADGMAAVATVAAPNSPVATSEGDVYWVDGVSGVLRRLRDDVVDCPLHLDCATAVAAPDFTPGALVTLTQTSGGVLYAFDAGAGDLLRITP